MRKATGNYKQFIMNTQDEYIIVFRFLLGDVYSLIKGYQKILSRELNKLEKLKQKKILVLDIEEYSDTKTLISSYQDDLLMTLIDQQKSSYSYKSVRDRIKKKNLFNLKDFSQHINQEINELVDIRNWTFHNPQSNIYAQLESMKKQFNKDFQQYIIANTTSYVKITNSKYVDIIFYEDMLNYYQKRLETFKKLFELMKIDFFDIKGEEIILEEEYIDLPLSFDHPSVTAANISMAIQKGRY